MTVPGREPTLFETDGGSVIAVWLDGGRVMVEWYGPRRGELSADSARSLGYLLRSYAQMAAAANEPGA